MKTKLFYLMTVALLFVFTHTVRAAVTITSQGGWFESAYVEFTPEASASYYNAFYSTDKNNWTKIDDQLVRKYSSSKGRADVLGIKAGTYYIKVESVAANGSVLGSTTSSALTVKSHDRGGFAHKDWSKGVGAYDNNGVLKSGARVIYVTSSNAKTVKLRMKTSGSAETEFTGLQAILGAYEKGYETRPLAIRIIGTLKITDLDSYSSSEEGIQIKGKGYSDLPLTIEGVGNDAVIHGFGLLIRGFSDLELRNFAVMNCLDDCISLDTKNSHVWVHNIDFFYGQTGSAADQKKGDGTVDLKGDSQYITISFNHFFDSGKSSLCGMKSETGPNYITYHHNWFDHSDSRHPRIRTMSVHVYNNYYDGNSKYGVGVCMGGSAFVESNYFRNCKYPMMRSLAGTDAKGDGTFSGESTGWIKAYGNIMSGASSFIASTNSASSGISETITSCADSYDAVVVSNKSTTLSDGYTNFDSDTRMHTYTPDAASAVPDIVKGTYGAGRMQHGNYSYTFSSSDDSGYAVIDALKSDVTNFPSNAKSFNATSSNFFKADALGAETESGSGSGDTGGGETVTYTPTLASLSVNGVAISGFKSSTTSYAYICVTGTSAYPSVTYTLTDSSCSATTNSTTWSNGGTYSIKVTAPDGTNKTYKITFSVASSTGGGSSDPVTGNEVYSYTVASEDATGTAVICAGGTMTLVSGTNVESAGDSNNPVGYKMNSTSKYGEVNLSNYTLKTGDVITIYLYQNSTGTPADNTYGICASAEANTTSADGTAYVTTTDGKKLTSGTITVGSNLAGKSKFYVYRNASSSVYLQKVTVTSVGSSSGGGGTSTPVLSSACDVLSASVEDIPATVSGTNITVTIPYAADAATKNLVAEFKLSDNISAVTKTDGTTFGTLSGNTWTVLKSLAVTPGSTNSQTFVVVAEDGTTKKTYKLTMTRGADNTAPVTYTVSGSAYPVAGGTVTISKSTANAGESVTFTATPNSGYKFKQWDDESTVNPYNKTINENTTLIATFTALSTDATLSNIRINGNNLATFATGTTSYNYELPYGTTTVPTVSATATNSGATVTVTQATATNGKATIKVTAESGATQTYSIQFSVAQNASSEATGDQSKVEYNGWFEAAYVKFPKGSYPSYNVYIAPASSSTWTKLDEELIREYATYVRADAVGLKAGSYKFKIVPVSSSSAEVTKDAIITDNFTVSAHDRSGFAHAGRNNVGIGAYNNDGTLKANARVLYVTADNAKTVKCNVMGDKDVEYTGLQAIIAAYEKGKETRPLDIRFIGTVKKDDLDAIGSAAEGLQVKGKVGTDMNITIEGIGEDATVHGFGFLVRNAQSVEFRNFAIMICLDDCLSLDTENHHCWVHNMDFFYGGTGSDKDQAKGDGTVDIKGKSSHNTVSYNHFYDSGKCSLGGMKSETTDCWMTYHHNWFDHSDSRHPRIRTAFYHIYNNYFDGCAKYGTGVTMGGSAFVEQNYYRNTKYPMLISLQGTDAEGEGTFSGEAGGVIKAYRNVMVNPRKIQFYDGSQTDGKWDAVLVQERGATVSATALGGGSAYNNTADAAARSQYMENKIDDPENIPGIVTGWLGAGRMNHGDFTWTFKNSAQDENYDVVTDLKSTLLTYTSPLVGFYGGAQISNGGAVATVNAGDGKGLSDAQQNYTPSWGSSYYPADYYVGNYIEDTTEGDTDTAPEETPDEPTLSDDASATFTLAGEDIDVNPYAPYSQTIEADDAVTSFTVVVSPAAKATVSATGATGSGNTFTIAAPAQGNTAVAVFTVTAEDGKTQQAYTINITRKVAPSAGSGEPTADSGELLVFPYSGSFYNVSGSTSTTKGTVTVDGTSYSTCLKMESATTVTFTTTKDASMKLVMLAAGNTIKVDGSSWTAGTGGVIEIDNLSAGTHTITKDGSYNLFYAKLTYAEEEAGGNDGTLNLTDAANYVAGTYEAGKVTYTRNTTSGNYGSFCLPFDFDTNDAEGIAKVYVPVNVALHNTTTGLLTIFLESKSGQISAGTPFIAKCSGAIRIFNSSPVSLNSTMVNPESIHLDVFETNGNDGALLECEDMDVTLNGTYVKTSKVDGMMSFNTNGSFGYHNGESLSAFRAYLVATSNAGNMSKFIVHLTLDDDIVTSIRKTVNNVSETVDVYTVNGILVRKNVSRSTALDGLTKGAYIINKKVIIK